MNDTSNNKIRVNLLTSCVPVQSINDGAGAAVVATEEYVNERCARGVRPLARLVAYETLGCDPKTMGIGPALAIRALLERTGLQLAAIDMIEVIEVREFCALYSVYCAKQCEGCERDLKS